MEKNKTLEQFLAKIFVTDFSDNSAFIGEQIMSYNSNIESALEAWLLSLVDKNTSKFEYEEQRENLVYFCQQKIKEIDYKQLHEEIVMESSFCN